MGFYHNFYSHQWILYPTTWGGNLGLTLREALIMSEVKIQHY